MRNVLIAYYSRTGNTQKMTDLGPFMLKEAVIPTPSGIHACQDYGKNLAQIL